MIGFSAYAVALCLCSSAQSAPLPEIRSVTGLVVEDSHGKMLGPVFAWPVFDVFPTVLFEFDGEVIQVGVAKNYLQFAPYVQETVYFSSANCSGQAFLEGTPALGKLLAVAGENHVLYVSRNEPAAWVDTRSLLSGQGDHCYETTGGRELNAAVPTVQFADMFVPPFHFRVKSERIK